MPAKKKVDGAKLIQMVENGTHQRDIMKAFKFNTTAQLKSHLLDALTKAGKAPKITAGKGKKAASEPKEVLVRKSGSVIIPKSLIETMEFSQGDKFIVRKTKSGISLRKV